MSKELYIFKYSLYEIKLVSDESLEYDSNNFLNIDIKPLDWGDFYNKFSNET